MTPTNKSENYLPTLDGWRAIAIFGVMIYHATSSIFDIDGTYPNKHLYDLVGYGTLGVPIFFGISGFLICTRLLQEENQSHINLSNFYVRRCCRILPPYLTYLAVLSVMSALGIVVVERSEWLSCLLFYRNYSMSIRGGWYTGHFWSLAVEEHFYLLWPGLLVLCGSKRARWLVVVLALMVAFWRAAEYRHQWLIRLLPTAGFSWRTDVRIDGLLWGCWIALLLIIPKWRDRLIILLSPWRWLGLIGIFVCCLLYQPYLTPLWLAFLIPLIIVGTVLHPSTLMGSVLELPFLRWVGRLSYSLYIWQQLFLIWKSEYRSVAMGALQNWPLNILLAFACAILSYYFIERPAIRLGHRLAPSQIKLQTPPEIMAATT